MKILGLIIPLLLLVGLLTVIMPTPQDRGTPSYHAPQQQHMRKVAKALIIFEHEHGRRINDYPELESYIEDKGTEIGVSTRDLIFTTPTGIAKNWILYPTIDEIEYLVASPLFDWRGETRRLAHRMTATAEEKNVILREPRKEGA